MTRYINCSDSSQGVWKKFPDLTENIEKKIR